MASKTFWVSRDKSGGCFYAWDGKPKKDEFGTLNY